MPENHKRLSLNELRKMWEGVWGMPPNARIGRTMLEKSLQYKILEKNGQGLSSKELAELNKLIKVYKRHPQRFGNSSNDLKEGTRLVRTWKGVKHEVTVYGAEFRYRGIIYGSLSKIANDITGKSWNGLVFFGLKGKNKS